ncbi:MAG TPA: ABC transporter permease [Acidimicrobiales bacterium]|nr:ABC transporter permease [Acidimicrobiales bacterium]
MRSVYILPVIVLALGLRLWTRARRRRPAPSPETIVAPPRWRQWESRLGDVGLVARREVLERVRGRLFRVGTIIILLAVVAAIVIPSIKGGPAKPQRAGVVGPLTISLERIVTATAAHVGVSVDLSHEGSVRQADRALAAGSIDFYINDGKSIVTEDPLSSKGTSDTTTVIRAISDELGIQAAYERAGLSSSQVSSLEGARPLPVVSVKPGSNGAAQTTSVIGAILLFVMLSQYNTWILMGVMQEKASRVVEVLLAAVRPLQLLGGKVLGIGIVAMSQAALIVAVALITAAATGSDLLHGTGPLQLVSDLVWLVLGYAFYCWMFAAAGSTAERQDQVQTLVFPLSLPSLLGYIMALTTAGTGSPSLFFKVLAFLPPTAPFDMPVLVGLGQTTWWQFMAAVLFSLVGTAGMAMLAARIYRRAVLRTGTRVKVRELFSNAQKKAIA